MEKINAVITGIGGYVPDYVLNNQELSRMVDTNDEWIMTRVGIKEALEFINILKINDDELAIIKSLFYPNLQNDNEILLKNLNKDFNIDYIFLTLGKSGASSFYNNQYIFKPSNKIKVAGYSITKSCENTMVEGATPNVTSSARESSSFPIGDET